LIGKNRGYWIENWLFRLRVQVHFLSDTKKHHGRNGGPVNDKLSLILHETVSKMSKRWMMTIRDGLL
jgi:hypothetical protein